MPRRLRAVARGAFRRAVGRGMARKQKPASSAKPAEPLTHAQWKARAVEIMGGRAGTMPEREWKRAYITNMTAKDAAALAETYKRNTMAADPKRRRR